MTKIGYLCSEYPALSHTFITREIRVLEQLGLSIEPCSINPTKFPEKLETVDREYASRTTVIKATGKGRLLGLVLGAFLTPSGWRSLRSAWRLCVQRGPRDRVKALGYWIQALALDDWARRRQVGHVHVHFANPAATVALIALSLGRLEMSLSVHGPDEFFDIERNLLREKIQASRFVRCISHYSRSQLQRLVPSSLWDKFVLVRCGIYHDEFPFRGVVSDDKLVVCVGRLSPAKGQAVLLQASRLLLDRGWKFRVALLGAGDDEPALREAVARLHLESTVEFRGPVAHSEVVEVLSKAAVFVLPSFAEGVPVALMEAMAAGVPVVSTRIMGIPELIEHGVEGLLTPASDVEGLAGALEALWKGDIEVPSMIRRAREKVEQNYDVERNTAQLATIFRGLEA